MHLPLKSRLKAFCGSIHVYICYCVKPGNRIQRTRTSKRRMKYIHTSLYRITRATRLLNLLL